MREPTGFCLADPKVRRACSTSFPGGKAKTAVVDERWGEYDTSYGPYTLSNYKPIRRGPKEVGRQTVVYLCLTDKECPHRSKGPVDGFELVKPREALKK